MGDGGYDAGHQWIVVSPERLEQLDDLMAAAAIFGQGAGEGVVFEPSADEARREGDTGVLLGEEPAEDEKSRRLGGGSVAWQERRGGGRIVSAETWAVFVQRQQICQTLDDGGKGGDIRGELVDDLRTLPKTGVRHQKPQGVQSLLPSDRILAG